MKLKLDDKGAPVLENGLPVYVDDQGRETAVDVGALMTSAGEHKRAARERERELAETLAKLDAASKGGTADAERIKAAYEAQLGEWKTKAEQAEAERASALIDIALTGSEFVAKRVHESSRPLVPLAYRNHLAVDGKRVVVKDEKGQVIHSRSNPLEPASVDEGLEQIISRSPFADRILLGTQKPGSGTSATPAPPTGAKTMSGAEFRALDPAAQLAAAKAGVRIA
jgi:hypothetical protein